VQWWAFTEWPSFKRPCAEIEPLLASTQKLHQSNHTTNKMGNNSLTSRTEIYFEGPDATGLNTVDIWTTGSDLASDGDERLWVMFVPASDSLLNAASC
jgi:hypothetical protein